MIVDLRSDTVTRPTPEMYAAMAEAPLGDDVLGDEPTVQRLQDCAAEMTGHEAALFFPSGTMANQAAIATHTRPGDSILVEDQAHILWYEGGAPAVISSVAIRSLAAPSGIMSVSAVREAIFARSHHTPGTSLICLENTHNRHGGTIIPLEVLASYRSLGVTLHMDGARAWNAAVALGVPISEIASHVDSISLCLSKGLRAPVGTVLCGSRDFIEAAAFWRKRLGGGMRQSGILAACGLVSLSSCIDRLAEDHARARDLAAFCLEIPGLTPRECPTNILILETTRPSSEWESALRDLGVWTVPFGPQLLRAVFHADVDDTELQAAKGAFAQVGDRLAG